SPTPIESYLQEFERTAEPLGTSVFDLIRTKATPLIPSDRPVLLFSERGNLRLIQLDGKEYIDPRIGQPFRVPLSELIDDNVNIDPRFRTTALTISTNVTEFVPLLSEYHPL